MDTQHVPTGKEFKISTITELANAATETNIDYLLADLRMCLLAKLSVDRSHKIMFGEMSSIPMIHFHWIDDGKSELLAIKFLNEKGDTQFEINKESFNNQSE